MKYGVHLATFSIISQVNIFWRLKVIKLTSTVPSIEGASFKETVSSEKNCTVSAAKDIRIFENITDGMVVACKS